MGHYSDNSLVHATAPPISAGSGWVPDDQLTADFGEVAISPMVRSH